MVSFAGAVVVGLAVGHSAGVILSRAIVVMLAAWPVGWLVGRLAQHYVEQSIEAYKQAHPIPDVFDEQLSDGDQEDEDVIMAMPAEETDRFTPDQRGEQAGLDQPMPGSRRVAGVQAR